MRLIYIDEAGTSDREKRRIVFAVIVEGDKQHPEITKKMQETAEALVPKKYLDAYLAKYGHFIFHAKEVANGGSIIQRDDPDWPKSARLEFIKEMVSLPRANAIPMAFGLVNKGGKIGFPRDFFSDDDSKIDRNLYEHMAALVKCVDRSDHFLRKYLKGQEKGTLVCEDFPHRRRMLKRAATALRGQSLVF